MVVLTAIFYVLPMYLANIAPVLVRGIPIWDRPMDGGKDFKGVRLLGENKTWRGFWAGILMGVLTVYLQRWAIGLLNEGNTIVLVDYNRPDIWLLGLLMGAGALMGDAIKSFFKRRSHRAPGSSWAPFDQLDFLAGGLLLSGIWYIPPLEILIVLFVVTPILHLTFNYVSFKLGVKEVPW